MRDGETGLLVERGDTDALADAVVRLLSDEGLREKMGAEARKFVSENFTWDLCAQKMLRVYREALGDCERRPIWLAAKNRRRSSTPSAGNSRFFRSLSPNASGFFNGVTVSFDFGGSVNVVVSWVEKFFARS